MSHQAKDGFVVRDVVSKCCAICGLLILLCGVGRAECQSNEDDNKDDAERVHQRLLELLGTAAPHFNRAIFLEVADIDDTLRYVPDRGMGLVRISERLKKGDVGLSEFELMLELLENNISITQLIPGAVSPWLVGARPWRSAPSPATFQFRNAVLVTVAELPQHIASLSPVICVVQPALEVPDSVVLAARARFMEGARHAYSWLAQFHLCEWSSPRRALLARGFAKDIVQLAADVKCSEASAKATETKAPVIDGGVSLKESSLALSKGVYSIQQLLSALGVDNQYELLSSTISVANSPLLETGCQSSVSTVDAVPIAESILIFHQMYSTVTGLGSTDESCLTKVTSKAEDAVLRALSIPVEELSGLRCGRQILVAVDVPVGPSASESDLLYLQWLLPDSSIDEISMSGDGRAIRLRSTAQNVRLVYGLISAIHL